MCNIFISLLVAILAKFVNMDHIHVIYADHASGKTTAYSNAFYHRDVVGWSKRGAIIILDDLPYDLSSRSLLAQCLYLLSLLVGNPYDTILLLTGNCELASMLILKGARPILSVHHQTDTPAILKLDRMMESAGVSVSLISDERVSQTNSRILLRNTVHVEFDNIVAEFDKNMFMEASHD